MTKKGTAILISVLTLIMAAFVFYDFRFGKTPEEKITEIPTASAEDALQTAERLSSAAETARQNGTAKIITLADNGSTASAVGVQIQGNTVTITSPGVYSVSGRLTEGQLTVDCDDEVTLILESAEITNSSDAAICCSDAGHTLIYLPEGSINRLVSGAEQEITAISENEDSESASGAALYARDSLSLAGSGKLFAGGYINNAIAATDHLAVLGGELELEAVNNGLKGKDSVTVLGGTVSIHSGNDGIKANNDTDANCGHIDIRGGEISIVSYGDGISAEKNLSIEDGVITVSAGDTASIGSEKPMRDFENLPGNMGGRPEAGFMPQDGEMPPERPNEPFSGGFPGNGEKPGFPGAPGEGIGTMPPEPPDFGEKEINGGMPQGFPPQEYGGRMDDQTNPADNMHRPGKMRDDFPELSDRERSNDSDLEAGAKGLKSGGDLTVSGGSITVSSADDCIHANGSITVTGGAFLLRTGDDGIHADDTLTVTDGDITVSESYEGLEGRLVYLNGGSISVTASDDGVNAAGGSSVMFGGMPAQSAADNSSFPTLQISGGTLYVNADGDGLDSNGDLIVEGGTVIVDGPTNSGNGALDSGSESGGRILCNGGTVLAIGAPGMAESFGGDSTQCSFIKNFSKTMPAGTLISISDESGKTVFEHTSAKTFSSVVFSSPELVIGKTYTVTVGTETDTVTVESISNGDSYGLNPPGGFNGRERR